MGRRRRYIEPFEVEIESLGPKSLGRGVAPDGKPVFVRFAPMGSRLAVQVHSRKKGTWHARRTAMVRPSPDRVAPRCQQFLLCGGCGLQEMPLESQRAEKHKYALSSIEQPNPIPSSCTVHPPRGADSAYGYRNKVELSFGVRRYLSEADMKAGLEIGGRFLGFHAPGRFDRVVDAPRCELISEEANTVLETIRTMALRPDGQSLNDVREQSGFWRHLLLRQGFATGEILIALYTRTATEPTQVEEVAALAETLMKLPLGNARVVGVVWAENDGVADVARGERRQVWGRDHLFERLGNVTYRISPESFFQTSTQAAEVLYDTIGEAVGHGQTLVDLYCGAGSIGLYLANQFQRIVGIEEVAPAVADAEENAARNGVSNATYTASKVEDALKSLEGIGSPRSLVVDPPRAGLHPKVAKALAAADAEVLVYVACHPASLGRDRAFLEEGGWTLTDLWTVDLFPQTGHIEAVARFTKVK